MDHEIINKLKFSSLIPVGILLLIFIGTLLFVQYRQIPDRTLSQPKPATNNLLLNQYVNPFIGTAPGGSKFGFTGNSGDVFPGAAAPMGMLQWSPDTNSNPPGGYYYPDHQIKGFSLTHFSGRGCQSLQDIPFMPYVGKITYSPASNSEKYWSYFSHNNEEAHPGYYKVLLKDQKISVELTAATHTGMGKFVYPASKESTMLINTGGSIKGNQATEVTINQNNKEVTGYATSTVGCGDNPYTVYFVAKFDRPFTSYGVWHGSSISPNATAANGTHTGGYIIFDTTKNDTVQVIVSISFVSIANARKNMDAESDNWNFTKMRNATDGAWNNILNKIQVQGGTADEKINFYTALYHTFFHPNMFDDVNGQYRGFDNKTHTVAKGHHQYENIPGWDQYRSLISLRTILAPEEASDIAQSLVNDSIQGDGHLPRWEQENADSRGMIGDSADVEIANIYAFGGQNFDTSAALEAMSKGQNKIREGLDDYINKKYVSTATPNSAARTLEYSIDDFSIGQFAHQLGYDCQSPLYKSFINRSKNWASLFNLESKYIQPRSADGSWPTFDPTSQNGFIEGNSAQYSWLIPHDLLNLFTKMGGNSAVVKRLDNFFSALNDGPDSQYAFMGNEPSFEIPWEYNFAGAPSRTQDVIRKIQLGLFHNSPAGLPGNDDAGSLSSWYVFSAIGLYPEIPGVGGLTIGSPLFSSIKIKLAGNKQIEISAPAAADDKPYVQNLIINGQPASSSWIPWNTLKSGADLNFSLGSFPSRWAGTSANMPSLTDCSN